MADNWFVELFLFYSKRMFGVNFMICVVIYIMLESFRYFLSLFLSQKKKEMKHEIRSFRTKESKKKDRGRGTPRGGIMDLSKTVVKLREYTAKAGYSR